MSGTTLYPVLVKAYRESKVETVCTVVLLTPLFVFGTIAGIGMFAKDKLQEMYEEWRDDDEQA